MGIGMGPAVVYDISAPLESVQWPQPVRFSTSGITSGKVISTAGALVVVTV